MQSNTLNILFVEDSEDDFQLVLRELQKGGLTVAAERVEDIESLKAALEMTKWDIVITDYALPGFTGLSALKIIKHKNPNIPVVVVSGSIGEEIAVEAMKAGAQDYVMKDNLKRLTPAVVRELQEFQSRKAAEEAFEASEERLRTLFETAEDGIFIKNKDLVYTQVNSAFAKFLRRSVNQITGKTDLELFAKEESEYIRQIDRRVLQGETIKEDYSNPVQETVRTYHIIKVPLRDKSDNIIGICGFARDITDRKKSEDALKISYSTQTALMQLLQISMENEPINQILESALDIILSVSFVKLEQMAGIFLKDPHEDALVLTANRNLPDGVSETCLTVPFGHCLCGKAAETGQIQFCDCIDERHENRYADMTPHGHYNVPIISQTDKVLGVIVLYLAAGHKWDREEEAFLKAVSQTIAGIIERKQTEIALRESELKYRELVELLPQTIYEFDLDGKITYVNDFGLSLFGYTVHDLEKGINVSELFAPHEFEQAQRYIKRILAGAKISGNEYKAKRKDGSYFYVITYLSPVYRNKKHIGWRGTSIDITDRKQATMALQESEERYRSLFEEVPISLWEEDFSKVKKHLDKLKAQGIDDFCSYFDAHPEEVKYLESLTRIVYINKATIQMFEARSKKDLINNMSLIKTEESTERFKKELLALIGGKTRFTVEGVSQTISGKKLYIYIKLNIAPGYEKTWERILISVNNLTEREKMTRAIKESEKQFRAIFEDAPLMINSFDKSGLCQLWNKECTRITGLTMEDVRQKGSILLQFYPDAKERARAIEHMKKADGSFKEFMLEINGKPKYQLWANFRLPSGAIISMGHDITERIKNEETIRISEEKYRSLFETSRDGIAFFSLNGTVEDANHAFLNMLGYSLEELHAMSYEQYTPKKWISFERNIINNEILQHGYSEEYEKEFIHKNGKPFPVSLRAWLVRDEAGNPLRMLTIVRDLTRQKQTEEKLKFTQFSVERSGDAVYWLNNQGKFIDVNNRACQSLGYTREELLNMTVHDIDPDFPAEVWPQHWQNVKFHGSMTLEAHHRTKSGKVFPVEIQANFLEYNGVEFNCSFVRDITERKRAEQQLMKLSHAVEQSPSLVMITDSEGHIEYVNPKFTETTGYSLEDIKGKNPRFLKSGKTPPEQYELLWKTITSGNVWHGEFQNKKKDGSFYWQSSSISPIKDANGNTTNFLAVMENITDRKKLEEERSQLQAQILQAQKLETIGTLAGGIAHDFNNLLTPILGYSDMALNDVDERSQTFKDLLEINKAAARAKDLVQQILTFSRQLPQEQKPIRIQHIIKEALNLLRATIPSYIEIRQNIDRDCDPVLADSTQIHQVIVNLCTNSYHAMREKSGTLTISLKMVDVGIEMLQSLPNLSVGKYVCLTVSDTGKGMTQATIERIFEPFFTTKTMGEGTGLGLSVVHGIILSHGGDIHVQSKVDVGSIFQVYLPPVKIDKITRLPRKHPLQKGSEHVLFVDDEIAVAEVGNRILTRLGYQVTIKHNAMEALECFRRQPTDFDIIITDQTMPKMSGFEFAKEVIKIRENIPVVLISGYNDVIDPETVKSSGIFEYLLKPINTSDISKVVREALDTKNIKEN